LRSLGCFLCNLLRTEHVDVLSVPAQRRPTRTAANQASCDRRVVGGTIPNETERGPTRQAALSRNCGNNERLVFAVRQTLYISSPQGLCRGTRSENLCRARSSLPEMGYPGSCGHGGQKTGVARVVARLPDPSVKRKKMRKKRKKER
ncbi:unnamed protein product, partial [Prorocentrum cordatum]